MFEVLGQLLHRNHRESVSHLQLKKVAHQAGLVEGFYVPFHERIGIKNYCDTCPTTACSHRRTGTFGSGRGRRDGDLLAPKKLHNGRTCKH